MDTQTFELAPLPRKATWFFPALGVLLVIVSVLVPHTQAQTDPIPAWVITPFMAALLVAGPILLLKRRSIRIEDDILVIAATVHTRRTPVRALDLGKARIVDLDEHDEYKPGLRLFGFGLPGFVAGHFLLRNRRRAFCLLSRRERVLVLPQRDGRLILLSPEKPQELLARLNALAQPQRHH